MCICPHIHTHIRAYTRYTHTAPNTGLTLWFQQFVAMFLKRFYNSLRFFTAVITQLILPLLLILFGLVFAIVRPFNDQADDPARELRLNNSAISGTANLFWAQLQDSSSAGFNINFSVSLAQSLQYFRLCCNTQSFYIY